MSILAEMMFGNVSMKIVGDSVKVHYIRYSGIIITCTLILLSTGQLTSSCSLKCLYINPIVVQLVVG